MSNFGIPIEINETKYEIRAFDRWTEETMKKIALQGGNFIFFEQRSYDFFVYENGQEVHDFSEEIGKAIRAIFSINSLW